LLQDYHLKPTVFQVPNLFKFTLLPFKPIITHKIPQRQRPNDEIEMEEMRFQIQHVQAIVEHQQALIEEQTKCLDEESDK